MMGSARRWWTTGTLFLALVGGCRRGGTGAGGKTEADPLMLLPAQARVVIGIDLARARQAPIAAHLGVLRPLLAEPLAVLDGFSARTGFDPWRGVDSIVIARSDAPDQTGIVIRGALLEEGRLEAYVRGLQKNGENLVATKRGSLTLWSLRDTFGAAAFFADPRTLLIGTGGWAERMADLSRGAPAEESAAGNADLAKLRARVQGHPIWIAGQLPGDLRLALEKDADLRGLASAAAVTVTIDMDERVSANLAADLATPDAADATAEAVATWLVNARRRRQADAVLKGMTSYAEGPTFRLAFEADRQLLTKIADTAALMHNLAQPKTSTPSEAPEQRAIKFTPAGGEGWSNAIAVSDIRTFRWLGRSVTMMEIVNMAAKPVAPEVGVMFRDADGRSVSGESCVLPMLVALPRERMPCVVSAPNSAATADYSVALLPDDRASQLAGVMRANVKVVEARLESPPGPTQMVVGAVRNETRATLKGVRVQASFYDSARKLAGYGLVAIDRPLKPGAKLPFEVATTSLPVQATSFTATAFVVPATNR